MRTRVSAFILLAGILLSVTGATAGGFYGATVADRDLPSSYFKIGLFGSRPVISDVPPGSAAASSGLQRGDIILSINGKDITKTSELSQLTSEMLMVSVLRNKEKMSLAIDRRATGVGRVRPVTAEKQSALPRTGPSGSPATASLPTSTRPAPDTPIEVVRTEGVPPRQMPPTKGDIFSRPIKPSQDLIVFENNKGDVTFSHSIHLRSLSREQCMLCHRTANPTHESIQSRLDNHRAAHSFCRGCHQKIEKAPTSDCQVCHNHYKKD